ncbi:DUF6907 domain-containing protein [Actinacidiphila reveromycinica]|uniref:DUF6907 domain-containing protein n=1 Tax=Actinacidiphila reveromycinica TaxID=659352 RepID=UPI001924A864|nr:hypothetical protein [Streptomyces sp. SN-593]
MTDDPHLRQMPLPGPAACPPWCTCTHDGDRVTGDDDPIIHISDAVVWDMPVNRIFPRVQFDLVAYENSQERTPPVLEVSLIQEDGEPTSPASFDVGTTAGLDRVISELERTVEQLRAWRIQLPDTRDRSDLWP